MIIDFHTHTFPEKIAEKTLASLGKAASLIPFTKGTKDALLSSMAAAGVNYSVTLPVMTNPAQVEKINSGILSELENAQNHCCSAELENTLNHSDSSNLENAPTLGLIPFGGMHPDYPDCKKELKRLKDGGVVGIKLHPAYQYTDIDDIRMMRILDAASELNLIVLIHAGEDAGIPGHNYASVPQILNVIDQVHPEKFVLGHMGGWNTWDAVEQYLVGAPVWLDTAHALIPAKYHPGWEHDTRFQFNLREADFIRLARKHGTDKILFATDSPWQSQEEFIGTINSMALSAEEKTAILGKNGATLLGL